MSITTPSLTNMQNRPLWREQLAMGAVILPPILYLLSLYVLPAGIMLT